MISTEEIKRFELEFLEFKPQLTSYLFRLCNSKEDAEDLSHDVFIKFRKGIVHFKKESSFKTWVFSIATNLAKDHHRVKERWGSNWMDLVKDAHVADPELFAKKQSMLNSVPDGKFNLSEHLNYCFTCTTKSLLLNQQISLWLKEVYQFKVDEIALILETTVAKVKHHLHKARQTLTEVFDQKCALINKQGSCSQCTGLNQMYNPKQDAQQEANKLKLVKEARLKNHKSLLALRLELVRNLDPLNGESRGLHHYLLKHSPKWAKAQGG